MQWGWCWCLADHQTGYWILSTFRDTTFCVISSVMFLCIFFFLCRLLFTPLGWKSMYRKLGVEIGDVAGRGHGKMLIAYMWHIKMDWIQVSWDWNVTLAGFYFSMRTCSDFTTSRVCVTGICFKFTTFFRKKKSTFSFAPSRDDDISHDYWEKQKPYNHDDIMALIISESFCPDNLLLSMR